MNIDINLLEKQSSDQYDFAKKIRQDIIIPLCDKYYCYWVKQISSSTYKFGRIDCGSIMISNFWACDVPKYLESEKNILMDLDNCFKNKKKYNSSIAFFIQSYRPDII